MNLGRIGKTILLAALTPYIVVYVYLHLLLMKDAEPKRKE